MSRGGRSRLGTRLRAAWARRQRRNERTRHVRRWRGTADAENMRSRIDERHRSGGRGRCRRCDRAERSLTRRRWCCRRRRRGGRHGRVCRRGHTLRGRFRPRRPRRRRSLYRGERSHSLRRDKAGRRRGAQLRRRGDGRQVLAANRARGRRRDRRRFRNGGLRLEERRSPLWSGGRVALITRAVRTLKRWTDGRGALRGRRRVVSVAGPVRALVSRSDIGRLYRLRSRRRWRLSRHRRADRRKLLVDGRASADADHASAHRASRANATARDLRGINPENRPALRTGNVHVPLSIAVAVPRGDVAIAGSRVGASVRRSIE